LSGEKQHSLFKVEWGDLGASLENDQLYVSRLHSKSVRAISPFRETFERSGVEEDTPVGFSVTAGISGDNGLRVGSGSAAAETSARIDGAINNGAARNEYPQSTRAAEHPLPKLSHVQRLASYSSEARIRSQPNPVSTARHA
jgi:hypothetical protein